MVVELVSLEFEEAKVTSGADTARVEFPEPVVVLGGHLVTASWTNPVEFELGTDDSRRFVAIKLVGSGELRRDLARLGSDPDRLVADAPVTSIVARVTGRTSSSGSGRLSLRLLVAVPRIVAAEAQ